MFSEPSPNEMHTDTVDNGYLVRYYDAPMKKWRVYYFATPGELAGFIANYYEMFQDTTCGTSVASVEGG